MGRRGTSVHDRDKWVFNRLAAAYDARPPYPPALVDRLASLSRGNVCELGAGTGILSCALAARGLAVTAVEPADAMLERIADPRVRKVHAAAEDTGLPAASFDLVVLADAVQWVDPELAGAEVARLLAPGGACAVVELRFAETAFMRELGALLRRHNPKAEGAVHGARQLLALASGGAPIEREEFRDDADVDLERILQSISYAADARVIADARAVAARHPGARWSRELSLSWSVKA